MKPGAEVKQESNPANEIALAELLNDFSIDAIIAIDINYNVIAWNRTAAAIYEQSKKQATGKPLFKLLPSVEQDPDTVKAIEQALKGYKSFLPAAPSFIHRLHRDNHFIPLQDNDGNVIGVMNIVHDVAHRIKAEQRLEQLNSQLEKRNKQLKTTADEIASFTYITTTKIKEPIRQIYTGVEHMIKVEAGNLTNSGKANFRRMQSSLNRMDLLIDDILSLSQISILEKTDKLVNLNELLADVTKDLNKKIEEKDAVVIVKELCSISGHEKYLHLLFHHLLDNALKFNHNPKPCITVECTKTFIDETIGLITDKKEYYKVTVADNGIGIEAGNEEKIFSMFEKLHPDKYKGSGMGLTVVRKIMDAHDGFIQLESEPGKGSAFHCFFPAS